MNNLLNDTDELKQPSFAPEAYIEQLLMFPWIMTGDDREKVLIKKYGKTHQQERYAYLLMERILQ